MKELAATGDEQEWEDIRALYDGALGYNDHLVGELRNALQGMGAWDDTLVIVTADHGDLIGEHGLGGHRWAVGLYREVTHVPLIARFPGGEAVGERSGALVQLQDIPRTIADICGCADALAESAVETVNLRDATGGRGRKYAISERMAIDKHSYEREKRKNRSFDYGPHMGALALINDGDWEYVRWETAPDELFSSDDAEQAENLLPKQPEVVQRLRDQLDAWQDRVTPHPATSEVVADDDEQTRKRLEGLGYY
jgi:arylsulfatase A-like enzyme